MALLLGLLLPGRPWAAVGMVALALLFMDRWPFWLVSGLLGVALAPRGPEPYAGPYTGVARVESARDGLYGTRVTLTTPKGDFFARLPDVVPGQWVQVSGTVEPVRESSRDYAWRRGIAGELRLRDDEWGPLRAAPAWQEWATGTRRAFFRWARGLPPGQDALLAALVTGDDGHLDEEARGRLRSSGTLHLVAASGAQVTFLATGLTFLLVWLPVPRPVGLTLAAAALVFYALVAGGEPPIVRAVIMWLPLAFAYLVRRSPDGPSALGFGLIVVLLMDPRAVLGPGLYLSFGITGAMVLCGERWGLPWASGIGAGAASLPLSAVCFGQVPVYGGLATALLAFPAAAVLGLGIVGFLLSPLGLDGPFLWGLQAMLQALDGLTSWVAGWPGAVWTTPGLDSAFVAAAFAGAALAWRPHVVSATG